MPAAATAAFAIVVLLFVLLSRRLAGLQLTAPIVFTAVGWLAGRLLDGEVDTSLVRAVAEATLAVVLFHDAAQVRPRQLRTDVGLCLRLLLIGLPLTILLGMGTAQLLLPALGLGLALLLASALAPTDAGLGAATVLNPVVPQRVRRILNVESGLNDGLATPVVLFAISLVAATSEGESEGGALVAALEELAIGVALGVVLGALAGALLASARRLGLADHGLLPVGAAMVPLLTYYGSVAVGGNGFVAAFVSGTAFAWGLDRGSVRAVVPADAAGSATDPEETLLLAEWASTVLGYLVWTLFGYVALGELGFLTWQAIAFAVLSLTVLRMLPVALSLIGTGVRPPTLAFVGWFGPRGLASVVFAVIAIESLELTPELRLVLGTMVVTVLMSVVLHGVTAGPWAERYGAWASRTRPPVETADSVEPSRGRAVRIVEVR
jgi:NhaP-type Na+/H+ or K+/H+ antiporter